jgi:very-short-patch-repair endonuclease
MTVWELASRQHGVVTRAQLLGLGLTRRAIEHRLRNGRLHRLPQQKHRWRGIYLVGRPDLTRRGVWMAAVLAAGPGALLSHRSAAALWAIRTHPNQAEIEVTVPPTGRRPPGLRVHRRGSIGGADRVVHQGIPVTAPVRTLIDLGTCLTAPELETAVNEADKLDLVDPETLRTALDSRPRRPGAAGLRRVLDRRTFVLTDSELERRFLPLVRRARLLRPLTGVRVNGFKVDFYWPELGLVVETDGLRYHRTPAQQAMDRERDQAHTAAGLTPLRFTYAQVAFEPIRVVATLTAVADRLRKQGGSRT